MEVKNLEFDNSKPKISGDKITVDIPEVIKETNISFVLSNETSGEHNATFSASNPSLEVGNKKSDEVTSLKSNALSAIAIEYNSSDSDTEENIEPAKIPEAKVVNEEIPTKDLKLYRASLEIVCSSDENDSEEDSSSSDDNSKDTSTSSTESENEDVSKVQKEKSQNAKGKCQRTKKEEKGEFDDLLPIEDLQISVPEVLCEPFGEVAWIVEQMVVVLPGPGKPTLNLNSILFVERGQRVLGRVFDVFGQVSDPHYCIRFNSSKHIEESNIRAGMTVYFCPNTEYTSLVFLHELRKMKAYDPTDDDEAPTFSDDEEEQAYYQNLKHQKNDKGNSGSDIPIKRKRSTGSKSSESMSASGNSGWQSQHPWNSRQSQSQYQANGFNQQNFTESQQTPCTSQRWYGPATFQQNLWPRFPPVSNHTLPVFYPQGYCDANFRGQMGFRSPQLTRFSNLVQWAVRNQTPFSQSARAMFPLRPPPVSPLFPFSNPLPSISSPPPPPPPGV